MTTSKPTLSATSNERWESVSHITPRFSRTPVVNLFLRLIHWATSPPSPSPPSSPFPRPGYHDFRFFYMSNFRLHKWGNCRVFLFLGMAYSKLQVFWIRSCWQSLLSLWLDGVPLYTRCTFPLFSQFCWALEMCYYLGNGAQCGRLFDILISFPFG